MTTDESRNMKDISASEYIRTNFHPSDRIAVLVRNGGTGETIQRIATAERIADRKSTRLNSSHSQISYAVFCLKKKKKKTKDNEIRRSVRSINIRAKCPEIREHEQQRNELRVIRDNTTK